MTVCTLGHISYHSYLTDHKAEHVYEKHLVKRFLYFLIGGEQAFNDEDDPSLPPALPITDCARLQAVLGSLSPDPNSPFRQETVAAQLGKAVSCSGTACPDTGSGRLSEFFLLRHEINGMKNRVRQAPPAHFQSHSNLTRPQIISGHYTGIGADKNSNKLPSCNPDTKTAAQMQQQMINAALVVQYLREPAVFNSFNTVNNRMKAILSALDSDVLSANLPPQNLAAYTFRTGGWEAAYDEFMVRLVQDSERKMDKWVVDCRAEYEQKIEGDRRLTEEQKGELKSRVKDYAVAGVYSQKAMSWGGLYDEIRGGRSELE
jgi:hypothetical protein